MTTPEDDEITVFPLVDEDGNEQDYALLAMVELPEGQFAILAPVDQLEAPDDGGDEDEGPGLDMYAFAYAEIGDEVDLQPVEDEDLLERIFAVVEESMFEDEDEE